MSFGDMPDLCHRNPYVYAELVKVAQWMIEDVGFDGFRFDFVKGYAPWMIKAIAELRYLDKQKLLSSRFAWVSAGTVSGPSTIGLTQLTRLSTIRSQHSIFRCITG